MSSSFGDELLIDWELRMPKDPNDCDGWAYHWDYAECSTPHPTSRDEQGYATMFLTLNNTDNPITELKDFIKVFNQKNANSPKGPISVTISDSDNDRNRKLVAIQQKDQIVLRGIVTNGRNISTMDPNVGNYCRLLSTSMEGMFLLRILEASTTHGYSAIIDHVQVEFDIGDGRKLITVSGLGPEDAPDDVQSEKDELATRFTLTENGTAVARCHLSYRDGSYDPSMGPTIEMMAVHKDHRGKNILPLLWYWVRCFVEENFTLECMNTDCAPGHVMIKATQLTMAEVDQKDDNESFTDKEFFFNHAGFSVRQQKGPGALMAARRPKDEEAVLYIPLLTKEQIRERTSYKAPSTVGWTPNRGTRVCEACGRVDKGHVRCGQCRIAYYCNKACQKRDWKRKHKKWCGKSREEVREVLIEEGLLLPTGDGEYASVRGGPGMR